MCMTTPVAHGALNTLSPCELRTVCVLLSAVHGNFHVHDRIHMGAGLIRVSDFRWEHAVHVLADCVVLGSWLWWGQLEAGHVAQPRKKGCTAKVRHGAAEFPRERGRARWSRTPTVDYLVRSSSSLV